jgi:ankyrin repeat protein
MTVDRAAISGRTSPLLFHYLSDHHANWYLIRNRLTDLPEEAAARNRYGRTALYKALYRRGEDYPSSVLVGLLLDAYPPAMWEDDPEYCPLKVACWRRASLPIQERLLRSRPSRPYDVGALHTLLKSYENLFGDDLLPTIIYGGREGAEIWMKFHSLVKYCTHNTMENHQNFHAAAATPSCPQELLALSFSFFPEHIRQRDRYGKLPLHYFVIGNGRSLSETGEQASEQAAPVDEIEKLKHLLDWYPDAVTVRDSVSLRLPLHFAIAHGRPWSWIQLMLGVSADSLSQVDGVTHLFPFQLAACTETCSLTTTFELVRAAPYLVTSDNPTAVGPISFQEEEDAAIAATDEHLEFQTVERMMGVASRRDDPDLWRDVQTLLSYRVPTDPWYVVHAVASLPDCPLVLLELAVLMQLHELEVRNPDGNLPLHLAVAHSRFDAGDSDDNEDSDDESMRTTQIRILLNHYPIAASLRDSRGRLPLHVAVCSGQPWTSLKALIQAYPAAVSERDERGLYPFQVAAVEDVAGITEVYELLLTAPHLLCTELVKA